MNRFLYFLPYFSLFSFCWISTICNAQDTIIYKSGDKIVVKVISVGKKIEVVDNYGKIYYIYKENIKQIHYASGAIYPSQNDSTAVSIQPSTSCKC